MIQKIIRVGNSYAVTIPKSFIEESKWEAGQPVAVNADLVARSITIQEKEASAHKSPLQPEFLTWLEQFNTKYKAVLAELAQK